MANLDDREVVRELMRQYREEHSMDYSNLTPDQIDDIVIHYLRFLDITVRNDLTAMLVKAFENSGIDIDPHRLEEFEHRLLKELQEKSEDQGTANTILIITNALSILGIIGIMVMQIWIT